MNIDRVLCSNCAKIFELKKCENMYRCGDTYVCSYSCSQERYREVKTFDPGFAHPHTWCLIKTPSNKSSISSEFVLNLYDDSTENEIITPLLIENDEKNRRFDGKKLNDVLENRWNILCRKYFILCSLCTISILFILI